MDAGVGSRAVSASALVYPHERIDDLQCMGRTGAASLCVIQDPDGFCFGVDAVMLANFARAREGERVLDLGTGSGVIPILMSAKWAASEYVGLELQDDVAERAQRSVEYNILSGALPPGLVRIQRGDLRHPGPKAHYDLVTSNPPYTPVGAGRTNESDTIKISRHEYHATLDEVVAAAALSLRPGGRFAMIHRPHRLVDILGTMRRHSLEPKRMQMVHPGVGERSTHILIEGHRGAKPFLEILPPLVGSPGRIVT